MKLHNFDFSKKALFHPDQIVKIRDGQRPFPITVEIDLTNRCNHRCAFCYYAEHISVDKSTLNTETIKDRLTEMRALGTKAVTFTGGGEPTLHKDFQSILVHAHELGFDCGLITNGSAITPGNVSVIMQNLTWIRLSVAGGDAESYQKVQGVAHFERVMKNLDLLSDERRRSESKLNIGIRMLVTPENVHTVPLLADRLKNLAVDYLQLAPDHLSTDEGRFWAHSSTLEEIGKAETIFEGSDIKLLTSAYELLVDQDATKKAILEHPQSCYAHFYQIAILAEGHVAFCKNARGNAPFYIGNINENTMAEIWASDKVKNFESWVKPSNCGMFCKLIRVNTAVEDVLHPPHDMFKNFVG